MSRNQKNIIKFLIAVIALVLFGYCVCHDPFTWREGVGSSSPLSSARGMCGTCSMMSNQSIMYLYC